MKHSFRNLGIVGLALISGVGLRAQTSAFAFTNPGEAGFPGTVPGFQTSFGDMYQSVNGLVNYAITASAPVQVLVPSAPHLAWKDPSADVAEKFITITRLFPIYRNDYQWQTPWGAFAPRSITRDQILSRGVVTSAQVDAIVTALLNSGDLPSTGPVSFQESAVPSVDGTTQHLYDASVDPAYRIKGTLDVLVNIPAAGDWKLTVTSAMGEERTMKFTLPVGAQALQITNVEAGNCMAALEYLGATNTYFRQVPVIVRKDTPGLASMSFVTSKYDIHRYRLASLAVGQNSQDNAGSLPLCAGKPAMVRVTALDALGNGSGNPGTNLTVVLTAAVNVPVVPMTPVGSGDGSPSGSGSGGPPPPPPPLPPLSQTFFNYVSGDQVKSGLNNGQPPLVLPAAYVQPGLTVTAKLLDPTTNAVLDTRTITPAVIRPRHIIIHGYDVRPYHGDSGCPLARNPGQIYSWILPYINDAFPYSTVDYVYEGKVWLMDYGQFASRGVMTTGVAMMVMNAIQGWQQTDNNASTVDLYLALINQKYTGVSVVGMAWYGYRGLAVARLWDDEWPNSSATVGYNLAHEMGHCFDLEHAPSAGANGYALGLHVNRIDANYQYGGAGMAGGWGFSALGNYFLAENAATVAGGRWAKWDPMSYTIGGGIGGRTFANTHFNDLYTQRLMPHYRVNPSVPPNTPQITLGHTASGIPVFNASSATQAQNWAMAQDNSIVYSTQNMTPLMASPLPDSDPLQGVDPTTVDADDPTAPVLIVTTSPIIPGVTVPLQ